MIIKIVHKEIYNIFSQFSAFVKCLLNDAGTHIGARCSEGNRKVSVSLVKNL